MHTGNATHGTLILAVTMIFISGCEVDRTAVSPRDKSTMDEPAVAAMVEPAMTEESIGEVRNVHRFGNIYLAGATTENDIALLKGIGVQRVINIRLDGEYDFNEAAACEANDLEYMPLHFNSPETLTDEVFENGRAALREGQAKPTLLHCGSANRVGAIWLAHRVLDAGLSYDDALAEAQVVGLRSDALTARAKEYVETQQGE